MKRNYILVAAVLMALIIWILIPSDREKISARLAELVEIVNQEKPKDALGKLERIKRFKAQFDQKIHFRAMDLPLSEQVSNEELNRFFFALAERAHHVNLIHGELEFLIIEGDKAEVMTHFKGIAIMPDGKRYDSENNTRVFLIEREGEWVFSAFEAQGSVNLSPSH